MGCFESYNVNFDNANPNFFTWQICNRDWIVESILLTSILVSFRQKKIHLVLTKLSIYDKYFIKKNYHIPQPSTSNDSTSNLNKRNVFIDLSSFGIVNIHVNNPISKKKMLQDIGWNFFFLKFHFLSGFFRAKNHACKCWVFMHHKRRTIKSSSKRHSTITNKNITLKCLFKEHQRKKTYTPPCS